MRNRNLSRGGFTLVEALSVIVIVLVFAALVFSAMGRLISVGNAAKCSSNLRNLGMAFLSYAAENGGWTPLTYDRGTGYTWMQSLVEKQYIPSAPSIGCPTVFLCPSQNPFVWLLPYGAGEAYGMRINTSSNGLTYKWRAISGNVIDPNNVSYGPPETFLFMADSIRVSNASDNGTQRYYFRPDSVADCVHLRHADKGNFLFLDGSVQALGKGELVGRYGDINGNGVFIDQNVVTGVQP